MVSGSWNARKLSKDTEKYMRILNDEILLIQVSFKYPASSYFLKSY